MFRSESSNIVEDVPEDAEIMLLSEVHLDDDRILDKIHAMLSACEEDTEEKVPEMIIFMGNFTSNSKTFSKNIQVSFEKISKEMWKNDWVISSTNVSTMRRIFISLQELRHGFARLTDLLVNFPRVSAETQYVFVPGPTDPGGNLAGILPLPALPTSLTKDLRDKLPTAKFTTNPCRSIFYIFVN